MNELNLIRQLRNGIERFHRLANYLVNECQVYNLPSNHNNVFHAILPAQDQVDF